MERKPIDHSLRIADLIFRQKSKSITPEELAELERITSEHTEVENLVRKFDHKNDVLKDLQLMSLFDPEENIEKYQKQYFAPKKTIKLWPKLSIAAGFAAILLVVGLFLFNGQQADQELNKTVSENIIPGRQGATLTLANGKKIRLNDVVNHVLAQEAGVTITKNSDGELIYSFNGPSDPNLINTLSTDNGETYRLLLPDGSAVWINAASSLTYSAGLFDHGKRKVKLEGEGYFEIAKDEAHPFVVETKGQEVEVLGTHFNIEAYNEEPSLKTTLLEGSVKVSTRDLGSKIIKPGQQAELTSTAIEVHQVDTELAVAWKNNQFLFEEENLGSIMRKIGRWYNVDVVYMDDVHNEKFGGGMSRFDHISKVLKALEETGEARFQLKGRTIYVSR